MTLDCGSLREAVIQGDAARVRLALRDATEAERRACATALRPLFRAAEPMFRVADQPAANDVMSLGDLFGFVLAQATQAMREPAGGSAADRDGGDSLRIRDTAAYLAAELGLAGGLAAAADVAQLHMFIRAPCELEVEAVAGVLADRRPPWLAEFVTRRLGAPFASGFSFWPVARRLVRMGLIDRPDIPEYAIAFPEAIGSRCEWTDSGGRRRIGTVDDALLADPGLLEDEVWRLFTVPEAAWRLGPEWAEALARLAAAGKLERDRLIDAALGAFTRDFPPNRVGWYALMHDTLGLSVDEMAGRSAQYLGLLRGP